VKLGVNMLKEILTENITEGNFEKAQAQIKEINDMIDKAIKDKDKKTLDILSKELDKILKNWS
jgi:hypothetical protein